MANVKQLGVIGRLAEVASALWNNQDGAAMIYVTVIATALFGFAALAIDFSTTYTTHTQARAAAEAAAIAGASQLDGTSDAITRATNAVQATPLVQNEQNFAQGGGGNIAIASIRFLDGLPAGTPGLPENPSVLDSFVTVDPLEARFIEVTTAVLVKGNFFVQAVGGSATGSTSATAVAGFTQVLCQIAPLAVCNPAEANTIGAPFDIAQWVGRLVLVKASGSSAAWTPGDFGLVDIDGTQSVPAIRDALASSEPDVCVSAVIDVKPGQTEGARQAFNTRFDMYENPGFGGANARANPKYRPARNVTKGLVNPAAADVCTFEAPAGPGMAMALPRDSNMGGGQRFGNGIWDCASYWSLNHPSDPAPAGCTAASDPTTMSRFQLYRYEIDNPAPVTNGPGPTGEESAPACHANAATANDTPDRRIMLFAVINCIEHGPISGNSAGPIPVEAFVKAFLSEPVGDPPNIDTYLEVVDVVKPGGNDGILHDIVQLYR